jgi:hypothetical protein
VAADYNDCRASILCVNFIFLAPQMIVRARYAATSY